MKFVAIMGTTALLFVFAGAGLSYSQDKEKQEQEQKAPPKQEEKHQAPPQKQQTEHAQPQKTQPPKQAQKSAPAPQTAHAQTQKAQPQKQQPAKTQTSHASANPPAAHAQSQQVARTQQATHTQTQAQVRQTRVTQHTQVATVSVQSGRYAGTGKRIPDNRFREHFGSSHYFQISTPFVIGGYSRFSYGGFAFGLYDPWPYGWYYTDDVYVDYLDGNYYLYDRVHPGARIQINVVL